MGPHWAITSNAAVARETVFPGNSTASFWQCALLFSLPFKADKERQSAEIMLTK